MHSLLIEACSHLTIVPCLPAAGYILGGGQGDLSRMFGLACDQLVRLRPDLSQAAAVMCFLAVLFSALHSRCQAVVSGWQVLLKPPSHSKNTVVAAVSLLQIGLEMVDFKGNVVTANSTHNSDLMWASCGGGTGLGVVTRWTLKAHDLGKEPFSRITVR
jgi:FAD/FMN-containing dehydrogenase